MSLHPSITDAKLAESTVHCSRCGISERELVAQGRSLLRCARCKWTRYCSQTCQRDEWPTHKIKCIVNANTARALANDPTKHPNLLSDFRAWLSLTIQSIAWCSLNALEAKPNLHDLASKAFFIELVHVPEGRTVRDKFVLKEYAVRPRSLAQAAVASDASIARDFEKMSGKTSVAATIIKAGALVKVIGFDASNDALAVHEHSDDWRIILEKEIKGQGVP
ncbi:hypothetical protein BD410DRAFT_895445 [Rickenella mellea]|uniref:MYND-type domain-containing protein n=1 Tax=Rickenella mellea TaxID=50990 RepID=A0A4Y7QE75_9AGAM|nr:hypothetical protein BD410DRAFT_895445 [Rickenella mellea]